jgi:hypothetical protein
MRQPFLKVWPAMLRGTRKEKVSPGSIFSGLVMSPPR